MSDLSKFQKFMPDKSKITPSNNEVWSYTRVSSKEQADNNSLTNQRATNLAFAEAKGMTITHEFGGTYESASSDFTRKEFVEMMEKVENAKVRPYAILVYKISRFSRTGAASAAAAAPREDQVRACVLLIDGSLGAAPQLPDSLTP